MKAITVHAAGVTPKELALLEDLACSSHGPLYDWLAELHSLLEAGKDVTVLPAEPRAPETPAEQWDALPLEDRVAATIYNARAQSPEEMTAERWARVKQRFPGSARQCLEQAREDIDSGEYEGLD